MTCPSCQAAQAQPKAAQFSPGCLSCASAQIQDPKNLKRDKALKGMAAEGYIVCNLSPYRATFHRFDHVCNKYSQAADEVIRARLEWRQVSPALPEQGR